MAWAFLVTLVPLISALSGDILVPSCDTGVGVDVGNFSMSDGSGSFPFGTVVRMCWDSAGVSLLYDARDEVHVTNTYTKCNSAMYNQEVVEVFMTARLEPEQRVDAVITKYLEVELTPHNVLYVSHITNPFGNGTGLQHDLVACAESGVRHEANTSTSSYVASIRVPWDLLNRGPVVARAGDRYAFNMFRVVTKVAGVGLCNTTVCDYGAWRPTGIYPPLFHFTPAFGTLALVGGSPVPGRQMLNESRAVKSSV